MEPQQIVHDIFIGDHKQISILLEPTKDCKARKVISEVYTSLVLQCTVSGR